MGAAAVGIQVKANRTALPTTKYRRCLPVGEQVVVQLMFTVDATRTDAVEDERLV